MAASRWITTRFARACLDHGAAIINNYRTKKDLSDSTRPTLMVLITVMIIIITTTTTMWCSMAFVWEGKHVLA